MQVKTKIKRNWFSKKSKFSALYFISKYQFQTDVTLCDNNEAIIRESLKLDPVTFIETAFPVVSSSRQVIECSSAREIGDVDRDSHSFGLFLDGRVEGFSRLTSLEVEDVGILDDIESDINVDYDEVSLTSEINESNLSLTLHDCNRFNGEISLVGNFIGISYDYKIALHNKIYVKAVAYGIPKSNQSPAWVEYLVDAALNYNQKDYKMASLNYFSAYENFVTIIHDEYIFNYLARKRSKNEEDINNLRKFAQNRQRLSAKATSVAKFLGLFNDDLKCVIKKLDKYSEKRNLIAHGAATVISYDITDMAYLIFVYMHSIGHRDNVTDNDWKNIVDRKTYNKRVN